MASQSKKCLHSNACTDASIYVRMQRHGQSENIMTLTPSIRWVKAYKCNKLKINIFKMKVKEQGKLTNLFIFSEAENIHCLKHLTI